MQKTRMPKSYGNGFDCFESEETFRSFIAWWTEMSHFPLVAAGKNSDTASTLKMAA